jgi:hypothetical protein
MDSSQFNVPNTKPFATNTWELSARLLGNAEQTDRATLLFPMPARIVGVYPSVINLSDDEDLKNASPDDILVSLDANQQRIFTQYIAQTSQANVKIQYVTLAALNTQYRDLMIELLNSRPEVGITFRWKRFTTGTPIYNDALVSLSFFVQLDDELGFTLADKLKNRS